MTRTYQNSNNLASVLALMAKYGDSPLSNNSFALKYKFLQGNTDRADQLLQNAQTPIGAIGGSIAAVVNARRQARELERLDQSLKDEKVTKDQKKSDVISLLPEKDRGLANFLDEEDLQKLITEKLKPVDEGKKLDIEYNRLRNQKIRNEINNESGGLGGKPTPYNPKVAQAIDTDILKKSADSANTAAGSLAKLDLLENILDKSSTGKVSSGLAKAGQYIPFYTPENSKNQQAADSIINDLGLEATNLLKGPASDKDVARSLLTNPSFGNESTANKEIIKNKKIALKIARDQAGFNAKWISQYGSTLNPNENKEDYNAALVRWQGKKFDELGGIRQKEDNSGLNYKGHSVKIIDKK